MINDPFNPEEQNLIQQIQGIPRLQIDPTARDAIRQRMLSEFRMVTQAATASAAARAQVVRLAIAAAVAVTVTVIVVIVLVILQSRNQNTDEISTSITTTPITLSVTPQQTTTSPLLASQTATLITSPSPSPTIVTVTVSASETGTHTSMPETSVPLVIPGPSATAESLPTSSSQSTASETSTPTATHSATPSATASPAAPNIIVIEGPITNIVNHVITVYDFAIELEPDHPILTLIEIGDIVSIEGMVGSEGTVVATVISNLSDTPLVSGATVSLDGPVESINGSIIVVNGIAVQLAENDPLLQTVQIGQFVRVQGNFQGRGTTIVLVVVTIVVNTTVTDSENSCYWKESGMSGMGKWKCDGKDKEKWKDKETGMGKNK